MILNADKTLSKVYLTLKYLNVEYKSKGQNIYTKTQFLVILKCHSWPNRVRVYHTTLILKYKSCFQQNKHAFE